MRVILTGMLLLTIVFASCKRSKTEMIIGSWKGTKVDNPSLDSFLKQSQHYIDTMGKNGDLISNMQDYGTNNIDSLRHGLQAEFDAYKSEQKDLVLNTVFSFKKNNILIISFNEKMDTSNWVLDHDSLKIEDLTGSTKGDKMKMDIVSLSSEELKLKVAKEGTFSTVTFRKMEGKN